MLFTVVATKHIFNWAGPSICAIYRPESCDIGVWDGGVELGGQGILYGLEEYYKCIDGQRGILSDAEAPSPSLLAVKSECTACSAGTYSNSSGAGPFGGGDLRELNNTDGIFKRKLCDWF